MSNSVSDIDKTSCSGCGACIGICAHQAIRMAEDREGFLYPEVDESLCTDCGLCLKHCPGHSDYDRGESFSQRSFLVNSKRKKHFYQSATTGVCTILSEKIISEGGVVFGAELDEKVWKVRHVAIKRADELGRIRNSKYAQSDSSACYPEVSSYLLKEIPVLFVGTPCQVAGLKTYLKKDYPNLLTVDLVCHGTYSYKLLQEEIKYWEDIFKSRIFNFKFRSKRQYPWNKGGVINFDYRKHGLKHHVECLGAHSPTYFCYAYSPDRKNYNLRPSCYKCSFRSAGRYGDLTVGDSWKVSKYYTDAFADSAKKTGISLVIANSDKGLSQCEEIFKITNHMEIPLEKAFVQNALLSADREIPKEREEIYGRAGSGAYGSRINELFGVNLRSEFEKERKKQKKEHIRRIVKRIVFLDQIREFKNNMKYMKYGFRWWFTNSFLSNFPSIRFRTWCLRKMGVKMSKNVRLYAGFNIRHPDRITIEDGVVIGPKVVLDGRRGLVIKKNAIIAYESIIWTLGHDYNDLGFAGKGAPVEIGEFAWICSRAIILPGVKIGKGAVVASNSVVTKDVPPFSVVAGVPAKVVGKREEKEYEYGYKALRSKEYFN